MQKKCMRAALILCSLWMLVGCRKEPMIHLSEERQAEIEKKRAENTGQDQVSSPESDDHSADTIPLVNDPSPSFTQASAGTSYYLWDYVPFLANQLKSFSNGKTAESTYLTYMSDQYQLMQVERRQDKQVLTEIYQLGNGALTRLLSSTQVNPYDRLIDQLNSLELQAPQIMLQEPIAVGTKWQDNAFDSEITALYDEVTVAAGSYHQVIEVTRKDKQHVIKEYYAPQVGLIASFESDKSDQKGIWNQLSSETKDVAIVHPLTVFLPDDSQPDLVKSSEESFSFQTNGLLANSFQQLFQQLGFINESVQVNKLYVTLQNIPTVDFTPGVVAVLNQYPASERAVIQAIVKTIGTFFNSNQVTLTVNDSGLLPNTFPYPEAGVYALDQLPPAEASTPSQSNPEESASQESSQ